MGMVMMLFYATTLQSQAFEVGPVLGGSNYIGDVGATHYIAPKKLAYGAIFKWNRSLRHAFRFSLMHTQLGANDGNANDTSRQMRGYAFDNGLTEASLGIEFNFWEWDLYEFQPQFTPYLFSGINGIYTHDLYLNSDTSELVEKKDKFSVAIPMVIGVKGTITSKLILALEIGARYTFTDNIDGSSPSEFNGGDDLVSFGNQNTNDWYMFSGITLTYTFGRKPCYCSF